MGDLSKYIPEKVKRNWEKPILIIILLLAAFLTLNKIWDEGNGNAYYTAAVKSMLMSWHNFFFASFDPGGFITVDKPAPGLWLQCLFGLIFGVHGWSVILPEALCSVGSVAVLYHIVKRSLGKTAGLLAALFLSLTPIFIAASRSNNLDGALVLVCLLAVWAALKAAEKGSLKLLILSMALVGLGFNMKMLQAFMFLPAIFLVYFFSANTKFKKRILHLLISTVIMIAISLSWAVAVDLIPASERPYVGSSSTNSELELAIGYNGIERLLPSSGNGMGGRNADSQSNKESSSDTSSTGILSSLTTSNSGIPNEGGQSGILRLFNQQMAGQASWLLVLALFGILSLILKLMQKQTEDKKSVLRQLLCWAGMFVPMYIFFSISGHFHRYYLIMFAPSIAALSAIGFTGLWNFYVDGDLKGKSRWMGFLLPAAIAVTGAVQVFIVSDYPSYARIFIPIICIGAGLSALGLTLLRLHKTDRQWLKKLAAAIGIIGIIAAPAFWSYTPILFGSNASIPVAGPDTGSDSHNFGGGQMPGGGFGSQNQTDGSRNSKSDGTLEGQPGSMPGEGTGTPSDGTVPENAAGSSGSANQQSDGTKSSSNSDMSDRRFDGMGGGMMGGMGGSLSTQMIQYMMKNYNGERFLVAVPNAGSAESIILQYGVGVMAMGGFKGSDNAISLSDFIALVQRGELRYYLAGSNSQSEITKWVEENGSKVTAAELSGSASSTSGTSSSTSSGSGTSSVSNTNSSESSLYDLSGLKTGN